MLLGASVTKRATSTGPLGAITDGGCSGALGTFGRSVSIKPLFSCLLLLSHPPVFVGAVICTTTSRLIVAETGRSGIFITPIPGSSTSALSLAILAFAILAFAILAFALVILAFTFALVILALAFALVILALPLPLSWGT